MADLIPVALRETMRVQNGRVPLLERHLGRLEAGGCPSEIADAAGAAVRVAAAAWEPAYGRMTLVVGTDGFFEIETTEQPSTIDVPGDPTATLVESEPPALPPGAAKPADRSAWDVPLATARSLGADVAIMVAPDGTIFDTSQATLWLVKDGRLLTPPSPPALAGVSRGVVFDGAPALGIEVEERVLTPIDFASADEVFLSTAVAGVRAVRGRGGAVTERMKAAFELLFSSAE